MYHQSIIMPSIWLVHLCQTGKAFETVASLCFYSSLVYSCLQNPEVTVSSLWTAPPMAMKGIFKGLRVVSQIFAVKEREMEIGCPTDVKHVAHIGWGSSSMGNVSPSWMNDIAPSADLSAFQSFAASARTSWASQDFDLQPGDASLFLAGSDQQGATPCPDVPRPPRKTRKRKPKDSSPPRPSSSRDTSSSAPSAAAAPDAADGTQ